MLSYHFCEKYGENQSAYLDINNYNLKHKTKMTFIVLFEP